MKKFIKVFLTTVMVISCNPTTGAQERPEGPLYLSIQVTGEAVLQATPDQAELEFGVVSQARSSEAAATETARKLDAMLAALRQALGPEAQIKTTHYTLSPDYHYPPQGRPTITSYTATNTVQVKTTDLKQVGKLIDIATGSGANTIQALRFTLKDESAAQAQALRQAATQAQAKAAALAAALDVRVMRILSAEEGSTPIRPIYTAMEKHSMTADISTPIEPGALEVRATVRLTVEIAP